MVQFDCLNRQVADGLRITKPDPPDRLVQPSVETGYLTEAKQEKNRAYRDSQPKPIVGNGK